MVFPNLGQEADASRRKWMNKNRRSKHSHLVNIIGRDIGECPAWTQLHSRHREEKGFNKACRNMRR